MLEPYKDYQTKNTSFLEYAAELKKAGIKDHDFCLTLNNKLLVGVDPHSPNLTEEEITMITAESGINPWYFFREVFKLTDVVTGELKPYKANKLSIPIIWLWLNRFSVINVGIRQSGTTTPALGILLYEFLTSYRNRELIIGKYEELFNHFETLLETLPFCTYATGYMGATRSHTPALFLENSANVVEYQSTDDCVASGFKTLAGTTLLDDVDSLHFLVDYQHTIMYPTRADTGGRAIATTRPHTFLNDADSNTHGNNWLVGSGIWKDECYDLKSVEAVKELIGNTAWVIVYANHAELGMSDEQLNSIIADSHGDDEFIKREFQEL